MRVDASDDAQPSRPRRGSPDPREAGADQGGHEGHGDAGHRGHDDPGHGEHEGHSPEMFRDRFLVSLVLTLPILYFSPLIQGWLGYEAVAFPGSAWVTPVLAVVLFLYGGVVFLRGAGHELAGKRPGMMTLISLAITVAFVYSLAVTAGFPGEPFYWELATLIDVMLLGHWIEMRSVEGASRALEHLAELVPTTAHRVTDDGTEEVPVDELAEGDLVLVRPGEQVPIDGEVTEGASTMNEAFLTGESKPVPKQEGDEVVAGAVNGEGAVRIEVTRTGDETALSQIMRLVEEAQQSRSRFQGFADRAAFWLTIVALTAGAVTFGAWLVAGETFNFALTRSVTVLVITCPHALGLAIPLVVVNATSLSAQNGILVRNREAFERARDLATVAFDKTGTLTTGSFGVRAVHAHQLDEDEALALAAGLETMSEHPLAEAVVEEARERGLELPDATDFQAVSGKGVEGTVQGERYRAGRPEWLDELGLELPEALGEGMAEAEARGESVIVVMTEDDVVALIAMRDTVRESARQAVTALGEMGVESVMITGDSEAVARTVADELGIERYHARVLPEDKADEVRTLQEDGATAFVGDGINDAPALLAADLGVAIGAGTNVAIESADLVLVEDDPLDVARALRLSKATYGKMWQNLFWATGYNAVAIPAAAGALAAWQLFLSPAVGALLMSLSTVIVAINAMLLRRTDLA